jgi:hypothetical protein
VSSPGRAAAGKASGDSSEEKVCVTSRGVDGGWNRQRASADCTAWSNTPRGEDSTMRTLPTRPSVPTV